MHRARRTCAPGCTQLGTLSLTMVMSLDDESSSLLLLTESVDNNGLSSIVVFELLLLVESAALVDEHFCRLFICFKSLSTMCSSLERDSIA